MTRASRSFAARTAHLAALVAGALLLHGCASGPGHVGAHAPRRREYELPPAAASDAAAPSPGSLWRDGRSAALYTDARAFRENDLVVVKVEEIADAKRSSDTDTLHDSDVSAIAAFLQSALPAAGTGTQLEVKGGQQRRFKGAGSTARTERLTATVPALVRKVLPNGNLFIEGHRVVLVNAEEQHFYISGVVRPIDIDQENSVKSSAVADAEIEFTGAGVLSDNQRQGWAHTWLGRIWPF